MKEEVSFLPIGTIIFIKEEINPYMIIGYLHISKLNKIYDYICIPFPYGLMSDKFIKYCNQKDIEKIIFKGFESNEYFEFSKKLNDKYSIIRDGNNGNVC